ncbi:MAG: hypothetical protein Q9164_005892 [Protoblastenia rupestris]
MSEFKRRPSLFDTIFHVKIGPRKVAFEIHKGLLCHQSGYFNGALTGSFREALDGEVLLEDEEPELFQLFNEWIYSGRIPQDLSSPGGPNYSVLLDLYAFGERRSVPELQNSVIDTMLSADHVHDCPSPAVINLARTNIPSTSKLHNFLVDYYVHVINIQDCFGRHNQIRDTYDIDFILDVAGELDRLFSDGQKPLLLAGMWERRCDYHSHNEAHPRQSSCK